MPALSRRAALWQAFAAAMIKPWNDLARLIILVLGITGGFSIGLLGFSVQYYVAQQGFIASIFYLVLVIALPGFLGFGLSFTCLSHRFGRWILAAAQGLGLFLILRWTTLPVISAVAVFLLHTPFWASYHVRFALKRSQDNHGAETALSSLLFLWSGAGGTILAGWALQHGYYAQALIGGALLLILSTQLLCRRLRKQAIHSKIWAWIKRRRLSMRISALNGAIGVASDFSMAAWMVTVGLSPVIGGIMMAARPVLGFIVTPVVGRLVQKGGAQALIVGGGILALAWLEIGVALFLTDSPFAFLPGFALLAVGSNLTGPAEVGRWYKSRSPIGIAAREASLTLGRLPTLAVLLPLACLAPKAYPFAAAGIAVLLMVGGTPRRKR